MELCNNVEALSSKTPCPFTANRTKLLRVNNCSSAISRAGIIAPPSMNRTAPCSQRVCAKCLLNDDGGDADSCYSLET